MAGTNLNVFNIQQFDDHALATGSYLLQGFKTVRLLLNLYLFNLAVRLSITATILKCHLTREEEGPNLPLVFAGEYASDGFNKMNANQDSVSGHHALHQLHLRGMSVVNKCANYIKCMIIQGCWDL